MPTYKEDVSKAVVIEKGINDAKKNALKKRSRLKNHLDQDSQHPKGKKSNYTSSNNSARRIKPKVRVTSSAIGMEDLIF